MIHSRLALAVAAGIGAAAAHADPRIATRLYEASSIVTVHGRSGIESTVAFADDERIENIAVGNSAAWQVTPNKRANLLFLKPTGPRARTNMTVITDQRTYLFDLVSSPAALPVYMLRFSYPHAPRPQLAATTPVPVPETSVTVAQVVPPAPPPARLRLEWRGKGDRQLLPATSYDDGRATYLQWAKDATLPAILVRDAKGAEGPVNFTVEGDTIVVEGVPAELILRDGKQMAILTAPPRPAAAAAVEPTRTASAQP